MLATEAHRLRSGNIVIPQELLRQHDMGACVLCVLSSGNGLKVNTDGRDIIRCICIPGNQSQEIAEGIAQKKAYKYQKCKPRSAT